MKLRITLAAGILGSLLLVGDSMAANDGGKTQSLAEYVNIMRGSHSTGDFSRGNTFPAIAVPFGFTMWTPVNRDDHSRFYQFFEDEQSTQRLNSIQAFALVHAPSPWIRNRQTLQIMPVHKTDATGEPVWNKADRAETFDRKNETAKAHYYSLTFDNGTKTEISPTDHGAYFRFSVPKSQKTLTILFDTFSKIKGNISIDQNSGAVSGYTDHGTPRLYFYATFDAPILASKKVNPTDPLYDPDALSWLRFDTSGQTKTIGLKIATSFISVAQAQENLRQEIGQKSFDEVKNLAEVAWNEKLGLIQVEGATEDQKIILYSNMYRSFLYPNSAWETVNNKPSYMSPYTIPPQQKEGKIWVNNGFWDTYRTTWPLYTLLFPRHTGEMLGGFVNGYKDGGWTARWSAPGYVDSMVATSLDISLADAYVKGVRNFDIEAAYRSMVKNATVFSPEGEKGRKGMNQWPFYGYVPTEVSIADPAPGHVAWSLEGSINDFGIAEMAKALGKTDDYAYFANRAISYAHLFDLSSTGSWAGGWFRSRNQAGDWQDEHIKPSTWGYGYTEGNAWSYAFLAPQDGQGLANLYGGRNALKAKLDAFLEAPTTLDGGSYGFVIHEVKEAAEAARLADIGQYQHSNQPVHHVLYMYNYAGYPAGGQKHLRDVMDRLYFSGFDAKGESTGDGYIGDEDNGELSAWYLFSAMGFYPVSVGRPEYAIGAPYFLKMTVQLEDPQGRPHTLTINAPKVSAVNRYVQSVTLNGTPLTKNYLRHEELFNGAILDFEMGPKPSLWGTGPNDVPGSITQGDRKPAPLVSLLPTRAYTVSSSQGDSGKDTTLFDRDSGGEVWSSPAQTPAWIEVDRIRPETPDTITLYTLTSAATAGEDPTGWVLKGSHDGTHWVTLDERRTQSFEWRQQVRPFALKEPASYARYRLEFTGNAAVSIAEFELFAVSAE